MLSLAIPFAGAISVVLTILHILICVFLIFVVLLQRGRNQDLASAFGGGQSQANLAAMSTDDFLTRATKISAFAFMFTSLLLALFAQTKAQSVLDVVPGNDVPTVEEPAPAEAPATDAATPAPEAAAVPGDAAAVPGEATTAPGDAAGAPAEAPLPADGAPAPAGTTGAP
jgi:preprotein translocase subunit SecG